MTHIVAVPGLGELEFPDGMSQADMEAAIKAHPGYDAAVKGLQQPDDSDPWAAAAERTRLSVTGGHGKPQTRTGNESVGPLEQVLHGTPLGFFADETPAGAAYKQEHPFASEALKWGGGGALTAPIAAPVIGAVGRAGGAAAPYLAKAYQNTPDWAKAAGAFGVKKAATWMGLPSEVGEYFGDVGLVKLFGTGSKEAAKEAGKEAGKAAGEAVKGAMKPAPSPRPEWQPPEWANRGPQGPAPGMMGTPPPRGPYGTPPAGTSPGTPEAIGDAMRKMMGNAPAGGTAGGTTASVPFMVTQGMRQTLRNLGYADADIASMTPADARRILGMGSQL
jgi:hypothetical protein